MSAYVVCITSSGGLPLFTRKKGNTDTLPFSVIGSLNGVHMFGKSQKLQLLDSLTEDYTIAWQEYYDSLILIGISTGCTVDVLKRTLDSICNAIVLIIGIDEVKSLRNIERIKKELRVCYPIVDRLLDSLDCGDSTNKHSSDLVGYVETILCPENHLIQIVLDSFTECVDSLFSCVLIHGKIAAATDNWWSLNPEELKLLALLATTDSSTNSKDIPVFLPYKSPNVAFRFVCCTLIPEIQLCCLCGPTPILEEIEQSVAQCFKNSTDILTQAIQCHPRNFPITCHIDGGILGLLLVNTTYGKYMITRSPHQNTTKKIASSSHRLDILRTFFYQSVLTFIITYDNDRIDDVANGGDDGIRDNKKVENRNCNELNIGYETYWCSEYHKCYAMKIGNNLLCVLFNSSIPIYSMRVITEKTLKNLISDKQICW